MKSHAKRIAAGGVVTPTALGLGAAIANEAQTVIGLNLHGTGLAIYIAAFLLGAAAVMHGQLRLEAQKLLGDLSSGDLDLSDVLGTLGGLLGAGGESRAPSPPPPPPAGTVPPSPPSPPPPAP
jgi:hypothetical protein